MSRNHPPHPSRVKWSAPYGKHLIQNLEYYHKAIIVVIKTLCYGIPGILVTVYIFSPYDGSRVVRGFKTMLQ